MFLIWHFNPSIFGVFTKDEKVLKIAEDILFLVIPALIQDFFGCGVLGGTLRGLGLQKLQSLICLVSYVITNIPLSIILPLHVGQHYDFESEEYIKGLGMRGVWGAYNIVLLIQLILSISFIHCCSDWNKIAEETNARIEEDERNRKEKEKEKE